MRRPLSALLILAAAAACGTEPTATLEILLDELPEFTQEEDLQISGTVTRTPVKTTTIVVTVTRGSFSAIDTAAANGDFFIQATIEPNEANEFVLSATDAQGSASSPITVTVTHDDEAPTISTLTPADQTEDVARDQFISFVLSERLISPPIVSVRRMGNGHPGTVSFSADSLTVTFTPTTQFAPHSIYTLNIGGLEDATGNGGDAISACFITTTGGLATQVFTDPSGSGEVYFSGAPPASLEPIDLIEFRLARDGASLATLVRYTTPRSGQANQGNNASIYMDFDTDQSGATGVTTFKDSLFRPFDGSSTGMGAEYGIFTIPGQPAQVFRYIDYDNVSNTAAFQPDFCGPYQGFTVTFQSLGNDDGAFDLAALAFSLGPSNTGLFLDPGPNTGRYTSTLTGPSPVTTNVSAAPLGTVTRSPSRSALPIRRFQGRTRGN